MRSLPQPLPAARRWGRGLSIVGLVVGLALVYTSFAATAPPNLFSNQHAYFPHGLYASGQHAYLAHDWYTTQTVVTHPVFMRYVQALAALDVLEPGVIATQFVLYGVFIAALWLVAHAVATHHAARGDAPLARPAVLATLVTAVLVVAFADNVALAAAVPGGEVFNLQGLAGQYILFQYLQPSEFGVLILLGLALTLHGHWRVPVLLFAIATNIHVGYLIHGTLIVTVLAGWLALGERRWRAAGAALAIYGLSCVPVFIYGPLLFSLQGGTDIVAQIMTRDRIPHHNLPSVFFDHDDALRLAVMVVGAAVLFQMRQGGTRWVLLAGTVLTGGGVALVHWTNSDTLAMMHLWRGSTYYVPLALAVLLARGMALVAGRGRYGAGALLVGVVLLVGVHFARHADARVAGFSTPTGDYAAFLADVRARTTPADVVLIPPQSYHLRLDMQRPVFVDWKALPYYPGDVLEWKRRMDVASAFYAAGPAERVAICQAAGVAFYVEGSGGTFTLAPCAG